MGCGGCHTTDQVTIDDGSVGEISLDELKDAPLDQDLKKDLTVALMHPEGQIFEELHVEVHPLHDTPSNTHTQRDVFSQVKRISPKKRREMQQQSVTTHPHSLRYTLQHNTHPASHH